MTSPKHLLSLFCCLTLAVSGFAAGKQTKGEKPLRISQGQKVELADFFVTGKTTLFDFTSEYCGPCRVYADPLLKLHQARADLAVVKVDINRPEIHRIDWESPVAQQYGMRSIPHFKIYGPDGNLVAEGQAARQILHQWIEALQ